MARYASDGRHIRVGYGYRGICRSSTSGSYPSSSDGSTRAVPFPMKYVCRDRPSCTKRTTCIQEWSAKSAHSICIRVGTLDAGRQSCPCSTSASIGTISGNVTMQVNGESCRVINRKDPPSEID
jgi:hypothetical protein